jgi:hypothetical protein
VGVVCTGEASANSRFDQARLSERRESVSAAVSLKGSGVLVLFKDPEGVLYTPQADDTRQEISISVFIGNKPANEER